MRTSIKILCLFIIVFTFAPPSLTGAQSSRSRLAPGTPNHRVYTRALWSEPTNITSRNLFYGAGGEEHKPGDRLTFVEEEKGGSNPKFEVKDEKGVKWKVKLGPEAQSETAATRLIWAAGYFTDEDYYYPELQIKGMKKLRRGQSYVTSDGKVLGARLERDIENTQSTSWSWFDNPFVRSKELNGLKVLMAMINNWDLKAENNKVLVQSGGEARYVVSDLGATFGKTGDHLVRSRNNIPDFLASKFIRKLDSEDVDFVMHSRPHPFLIFNLPYYINRTKMEGIVHDIPRTDAKWIGSILARLSDKQLGDAFRAAGYNTQEINLLTGKIKSRIAELNKLDS